jgi:hypothetical protein
MTTTNWTRLNSALIREAETWIRKSSNPTYNEPQSFCLLLLSGNGFSVTSTWEELLAGELIESDGYERQLLTFSSSIFDTNKITLTSDAVEISATGLSLQFDAICLVADASINANKPVVSMTASSDYVNVVDHGLSINDAVMFTGDGTVSTGIEKDVIYYVKAISGNDFSLTDEPDSDLIDLTTDSSGSLTLHYANGWAELLAVMSQTETILNGTTSSFVVEWERS